MSEIEIKELLDKISNGEKFDTSFFTDEQKDQIISFIGRITKACEEIVGFITDNLIPIIEEAFERISLMFKNWDKDFMWQYWKQTIIKKQEIQPLYLDKRSKIHRCRNNC